MTRLAWLPGALTSAGLPHSTAAAELADYEGKELGFWFLLSRRGAVYNYHSITIQFPGRFTIPFCRRVDCDDIAAIVVSDPEYRRGTVLRVHDGAMPGDEIRGVAESLEAWLAEAKEEECRHGMTK